MLSVSALSFVFFLIYKRRSSCIQRDKVKGTVSRLCDWCSGKRPLFWSKLKKHITDICNLTPPVSYLSTPPLYVCSFSVHLPPSAGSFHSIIYLSSTFWSLSLSCFLSSTFSLPFSVSHHLQLSTLLTSRAFHIVFSYFNNRLLSILYLSLTGGEDLERLDLFLLAIPGYCLRVQDAGYHRILFHLLEKIMKTQQNRIKKQKIIIEWREEEGYSR